MGVDFVLDYDCAVKQQVSTAGMIGLVKSRSRANMMLQMARKDGDTKPPSEISVTLNMLTPEGVKEQRKVSIQSLIDESAPLDALAHNCEKCSARVARDPFGCYGSIRYPIRLRTEHWLMSLLPTDLESTAGVLLQKCIKDFGYDGGNILKLRSNPAFFEDPKGHRVAWKPKGFMSRFSTSFSLTSSQLLQMMFCVGQLQPSHCSMLCLFLGLIPHNTTPEAIRNNKTFLKISFKGVELPSDVPDLDGFLQFSDTLLRSAFMGVPISIDY